MFEKPINVNSISIRVPTSAEQIIDHITNGGQCLVAMTPHNGFPVLQPRHVLCINLDSDRKWLFGADFWGFQWLRFDEPGFTWILA